MRASPLLGGRRMKKQSSAYLIAELAEGLTITELPLTERTDRWWDMFWFYIELSEAQRLKECRANEIKHR